MEKILKKLFYKYFLDCIKNYDEKEKLKEYLKNNKDNKFWEYLVDEIGGKTSEIVDEVVTLLLNAVFEIESNIYYEIENDTYENDWETHLQDSEIVKCIGSDECKFKDCMHSKEHVYDDKCEAGCVSLKEDGRTCEPINKENE